MSKNSKQKSAVLFLTSQPIHIGEVVTVLSNIDYYDRLHLCLSGNPTVMPLKHVYTLWSVILRQYRGKITLSFLDTPPTDLQVRTMPVQLEKKLLLTYDQKIFTHFSSLGYPIKLLPKVMGFHEVFLRAAYRQSRALDWLNNNGVNSIHTEKFEKLMKEIEKNER